MLEIFDRPAGSDMSMWGTVRMGQADTSCYHKSLSLTVAVMYVFCKKNSNHPTEFQS